MANKRRVQNPSNKAIYRTIKDASEALNVGIATAKRMLKDGRLVYHDTVQNDTVENDTVQNDTVENQPLPSKVLNLRSQSESNTDNGGAILDDIDWFKDRDHQRRVERETLSREERSKAFWKKSLGLD